MIALWPRRMVWSTSISRWRYAWSLRRTTRLVLSIWMVHFTSCTKSPHDVIAYDLPNIEGRCELLNKLGKGLLEDHDGSALHMTRSLAFVTSLIPLTLTASGKWLRRVCHWSYTSTTNKRRLRPQTYGRLWVEDDGFVIGMCLTSRSLKFANLTTLAYSRCFQITAFHKFYEMPTCCGIIYRWNDWLTVERV